MATKTTFPRQDYWHIGRRKLRCRTQQTIRWVSLLTLTLTLPPPLGRCIIFTTKYWPAIVHPSTTAPSIFRTLGESPSSFHDFSFAAITWTTVMDWPVLDVKSWGRVGKNSVWLILRSVCQAVVSSYDRERERWKIILEALFDFFVRFSRKFFFFLCRIR